MARVALRHRDNVAGEWFVDERCIDCGTCRELAPELFASIGVQSVVVHQPVGSDATTDAWLAALPCPGRLFPRELGPGRGIFDCGYCSPDSFGATAWFVTRPGGNVLVDSPR